MTYEPESIWLIKNIPQATGAWTYVDLGCSHPTNKSLTAFCRDFGWHGVAIDGNPDYQKDWIDAGFGNHFYHAILSDQPRARFAIHDNAFTSRLSASEADDRRELWGINRIVEQETTSLNGILAVRGLNKIDLLTIDLEGHEFAVLQTLDFEKHSPAFIISEYFTHGEGEGTDPRVCNFLLSKGYEVIQQFPSNLIYRRK